MAIGPGWAGSETLAQTSAGYDLRPLSTGEVLDRTFQLYRSRFALFASLSALPAGVSFLVQTIQVFTMQGEKVFANGKHVIVATHPIATAVTSIVSGLLTFALYGITQAATTWAVSEIYLGNPAVLSKAWKAATAHWVRYILVMLRMYWSIFWVPGLAFAAAVILFAIPRVRGSSTPFSSLAIVVYVLIGVGSVGCIYSIFAALRVALSIPASVIESLRPNAAIRRSMALLTERKIRIFLLWLLIVAMSLVIVIIMTPLSMIAAQSHGAERYILQMVSLTASFLSRLVIGPVGAIAICLFYFDERVRREGFDIEFLMQRATQTNPNPAVEGSASPAPA
ncbi:MAG TPA: hypothetical protein VHX60_02820 [Acidobacteriaceae bacterium]|jgi:hypothetical protein|nr:hypothetical protein [Acidobacteriaceae bacterium]